MPIKVQYVVHQLGKLPLKAEVLGMNNASQTVSKESTPAVDAVEKYSFLQGSRCFSSLCSQTSATQLFRLESLPQNKGAQLFTETLRVLIMLTSG